MYFDHEKGDRNEIKNGKNKKCFWYQTQVKINCLVPLIEGLCSMDSSCRVLLSHLLFCFFGRKICQRKKTVGPRSHSAFQHIYTKYFVHIYEYIYAMIQSIWILLALQMSLPNPSAHIEYPMCSVCVCVCVYTHVHTHTLPPASKIEKTPDNTSISHSVKNKYPRQATSALHRLAETPHPRPPTRMNKLRIHERMCTPCSDCVANMYADVKNACGTCISACPGDQDTCLVHTTLTAKNLNAHTSAQARLYDGAATSSTWKPLRFILKLETSF